MIKGECKERGWQSWEATNPLGPALVPSLRLCRGLQAKGVMKTASSYRWVCSLQSCNFLLPTVGGTRLPLGLGNITAGDAGRVRPGQSRGRLHTHAG